MKIAILGFGREGKSVLKFLKKSGPRADIKILDQKLDKNYLKNLSDFDVVYRSPGVPYNLPEIKQAVKKGIKFSSATKLFFEEIQKLKIERRRAARKNIKIIGITGTKGKGTTATLLYKILQTCGKKAFLTGNIGVSPLDILPRLSALKPGQSAFIVLELSSFQLQDMQVSPPIAAVLDIFPEHLDIHKNLREYFDAKTNIAKWQKKSDKIFYFGDNRWSKRIASKSRGKKNPVQCQNIECPDIKKFLGTSGVQKIVKIPGFHNIRNILIAAAAARSLGCQKNKIIKIVKSFNGNEHRLEFVRKIKRIKFYNDSASTNPQTAAAAIRAFKEPKILIAGGRDKGLNYSPLAKALKNSNTKLVILFGENKRKIQKTVSKSGVPIKLVKDLKTAVDAAYRNSEFYFLDSKFLHILFSPASTSFDMFIDYVDRGKKFKELVWKLK